MVIAPPRMDSSRYSVGEKATVRSEGAESRRRWRIALVAETDDGDRALSEVRRVRPASTRCTAREAAWRWEPKRPLRSGPVANSNEMVLDLSVPHGSAAKRGARTPALKTRTRLKAGWDSAHQAQHLSGWLVNSARGVQPRASLAKPRPCHRNLARGSRRVSRRSPPGYPASRGCGRRRGRWPRFSGLARRIGRR